MVSWAGWIEDLGLTERREVVAYEAVQVVRSGTVCPHSVPLEASFLVSAHCFEVLLFRLPSLLV